VALLTVPVRLSMISNRGSSNETPKMISIAIRNER